MADKPKVDIVPRVWYDDMRKVITESLHMASELLMYEEDKNFDSEQARYDKMIELIQTLSRGLPRI